MQMALFSNNIQQMYKTEKKLINKRTDPGGQWKGSVRVLYKIWEIWHWQNSNI